jgi:hypothetical protein
MVGLVATARERLADEYDAARDAGRRECAA